MPVDHSKHLAQADRHIARAEQHISRQHEIIAMLAMKAQDTLAAEHLLDALEHILEAYRTHRTLILREIGRSAHPMDRVLSRP
jgi:hypothetical protein